MRPKLPADSEVGCDAAEFERLLRQCGCPTCRNLLVWLGRPGAKG